MKSITRKLYISIISLFIAAVALSTSTYAWFTMSNTTNIESINAKVSAGKGILISQDNINFTDVLDVNMYTITDANNQLFPVDSKGNLKLKLYPISSLEGGLLENNSVYGSIGKTAYGENEIVSVDPGRKFASLPQTKSQVDLESKKIIPERNVDYLEMKIYLRNTVDSILPVYLGSKPSNGYISNNNVLSSFSPLAEFNYNGVTYDSKAETNNSILVDAANAMRLSIEGVNSNINDNLLILQDKDLVSDYTYNIDRGGVFINSSLTDILTTSDNDFISNVEQYASVAYYNSVMTTPIGAPKATGYEFYAAPIADYNYDLINNETVEENQKFVTKQIVTLENNTSSKAIVIRLWLEGWDGDAFDAVKSQEINFNLTLTSNEDEAYHTGVIENI